MSISRSSSNTSNVQFIFLHTKKLLVSIFFLAILSYSGQNNRTEQPTAHTVVVHHTSHMHIAQCTHRVYWYQMQSGRRKQIEKKNNDFHGEKTTNNGWKMKSKSERNILSEKTHTHTEPKAKWDEYNTIEKINV